LWGCVLLLGRISFRKKTKQSEKENKGSKTKREKKGCGFISVVRDFVFLWALGWVLFSLKKRKGIKRKKKSVLC